MRWLADAVLVLHAGFVAFVIGGALYIWIGAWRRWNGARNPVFRIAHLAAIVFVAIESMFGYLCPLTIWEDALRGSTNELGFVARWIRRAIYFDFPLWVFTIAYILFSTVVAATFVLIPPRWRKR